MTYELLAFIFIWAFTDRIREVPLFWKSRLGRWFETYNHVNKIDAYHVFKWIPVALYVIYYTATEGRIGVYMAFLWGAGQWLGLLTAKK